jgi:hypothetical protein
MTSFVNFERIDFFRELAIYTFQTVELIMHSKVFVKKFVIVG